MTPLPVRPTAERPRRQRRPQLRHAEPGQCFGGVRRETAGAQCTYSLRFIIDERRQPMPDRPTMSRFDLHSCPTIATGAAQQCSCRRKSVLVQPPPRLCPAGERPGRRIHRNKPETGHRFHQLPARLDYRCLPHMFEEPVPGLTAGPMRIVGQNVGEFRHVRQPTIEVEQHYPLTSSHPPHPNHRALGDAGATPAPRRPGPAPAAAVRNRFPSTVVGCQRQNPRGRVWCLGGGRRVQQLITESAQRRTVAGSSARGVSSPRARTSPTRSHRHARTPTRRSRGRRRVPPRRTRH